MPLRLEDCTFTGPALPGPFVKFDLEAALNRAKLLPKDTGEDGRAFEEQWQQYRRYLREMTPGSGAIRIRNKVIEPLASYLGYSRVEPSPDVQTREGSEPGGHLLLTQDGESRLRVWTTGFDTDLDAPARRGYAYRFSHVRVAQRVLLAAGERVGLLTNGVELRILLSEPARPDSQVIIPVETAWRRSRDVADSFRLVLALCSPAGIHHIPRLIDDARLKQTKVTRELRKQARRAVELFVQGILDHPQNSERLQPLLTDLSANPGATEGLSGIGDRVALARELWREGLIIIYRLLFILKAESSDDAARSFAFAGSSIWRNTYSPGVALARYARDVVENGAETGSLLEDALRSLFRMFAGPEGLQCSELHVRPLGGVLFGPEATPILSGLRWGEGAVAHLLDQLLWTTPGRGQTSRERVHYGPLDVEDLGRVYEALLELEPGIAAEPMCRLRRAKLEVVVPVGQGERYRIQESGFGSQGEKTTGDTDLSGPAGVAEGGALGGGVLQGDGFLSKGAAVRPDQPAAAGGGVNSGEHRGGTWQAGDGRLPSSPVDGAGPTDGAGNAPGDSDASGLSAGQSLDGVVQPDLGDRSDAEWSDTVASGEEEDPDPESEILNPESSSSGGKKTRVEWIEEIRPGTFYLRVGLGRKASGSYYTPHSFVRFLVQETLGPQVLERCYGLKDEDSQAESQPSDASLSRLSEAPDIRPAEVLKLTVLDPAMGSGHFLVEACRFLGEKLYEACRLCDERMLLAERAAEEAAANDDEAQFERQRLDAAKWRERLEELPDPNDEIVQYLPSRAPEGEESGLSSRKAEALCRRMVAVHCLYGVDKNPLAVELARLSLWLESQAEGLPLTFLDHRLVVGDSLTGPFWDKLVLYPGSQQPLENLWSQGISLKLGKALADALFYVRELNASVGIDLADIENKRISRDRLERLLAPFKILAAAWAGGVMLGKQKCDDAAYAELVQKVGETGDLPDEISSEPLRAMIAQGLGLQHAGSTHDELLASLCNPAAVPALPYDLTFPEVFYPTGAPFGRRGFDAVIGNPPWDEVQPKILEFLASFDFEILSLPTVRERETRQTRILADDRIAEMHESYLEGFERDRRCFETLYDHQRVRIDGDLAGRQLSLYRIFAERDWQLLSQHGLTGVVVPSAFHANEGATGVRRLYLERMALRCCYSFENRRKLFEIDSRFKFATVVAERGSTTDRFSCAFYLHDDGWLFGDHPDRGPLEYTLGFVRNTGGSYLSLLELRLAPDAGVASQCYQNPRLLGDLLKQTRLTPNTSELPMLGPSVFHDPEPYVNVADTRLPQVTKQLMEQGFAPLHEGKTFHQFDDMWGDRPKYIARLEALTDRPRWLQLLRYYRLVYRTVARATDERTSIFTTLPYGVVTARNAASDITPSEHPYYSSLVLVSLGNSFPFDFLLRLMVQSAVSLFIMERVAVPSSCPSASLAHSTLRLICNHEGYEPLWREQLGDVWREKRQPFTWPVLEGEDERWELRAAIDAVVADAYGLTREQYEHVLSTFSHKSYPKAPALCLAKFDELREIGLEAFTRKYDPYWDIPLNENLPKPVIDLPIPAATRRHPQQPGLGL